MLKRNMGLREGERLLVLTDVPHLRHWRTAAPHILEEMLDRAWLARTVANMARTSGLGCLVQFMPFFATGRDGAEPGEGVARCLAAADAVIALTTYSLTHTAARESASQAGTRVASMPGFDAHMLSPHGPTDVDVETLATSGRRFAEALTACDRVLITTSIGTSLRCSVRGRQGGVDDGDLKNAGSWGNLPAGEAFIAPVEGSAEGRLVIPAGWHPGLSTDLEFDFAHGEVSQVLGGGEVGARLRGLLHPNSSLGRYRQRRMLAEFGIGTNPSAKRATNVLEAEKIAGTIHIAIGDNMHMGGNSEADLHEDFVVPAPCVWLDDRAVIDEGRWLLG